MDSVEDIEIGLLLEGVFRRYGHDYRGYEREPVRLKLHALMQRAGIRNVSALQERALHDEGFGKALLRTLCTQPLPLFDNPDYYLALRQTIMPWLRSCPSPRIWIAECGSVEDVCALSILLAEEKLHDKTQIFATALNESLLQEASEGSFPADCLSRYVNNYRASGGKHELMDYCSQADEKFTFSRDLRNNITWAQHSLATDASFNEFQLIVCRQRLVEFGTSLRQRTVQLFYDSMPLFGVLSVDRSDTLNVAPFVSCYKPIVEQQGLYRRIA